MAPLIPVASSLGPVKGRKTPSSARRAGAWAPLRPSTTTSARIGAGVRAPEGARAEALNVSNRDQHRPPRQASELVVQKRASRRSDPVDHRAGPLGELLPRDDVGMVLHHREHDPIARAHVDVAPGAGNEVDRLRRVADEDELAAVRRADVVGDRGPGALVGGGRLGGQGVGAAVDVGVVGARSGRPLDQGQLLGAAPE